MLGNWQKKKKSIFKQLLKPLSLVLFAASTTSAAAATFDENLGDFSNSAADPLFTLETGVNAVSGNISGSRDFDGFSVIVRDGSVLSLITYSLTNNTPDLDTVRYELFRANGSGSTRIDIDDFLTDQTAIAFSSVFPLDSGTYRIGHSQINLTATGNGSNVDADWSYSFQVTPVPLPAGAVLLFTGLGFVVALRKAADRRNYV